MRALGAVMAVLTSEQFDAQLPRVLPAMLALYKKDAKNHLAITQGMVALLTVGVRGGSRRLEPHLPLLLGSLFPLAAAHVDTSVQGAFKNHNELLRCFGVLGQVFSTDVVQYQLAKIESKSPRERAGTLTVLKHLVTRIDPVMESQGECDNRCVVHYKKPC